MREVLGVSMVTFPTIISVSLVKATYIVDFKPKLNLFRYSESLIFLFVLLHSFKITELQLLFVSFITHRSTSSDMLQYWVIDDDILH